MKYNNSSYSEHNSSLILAKFSLLKYMGKIQYKVEDILDDGECPVCGSRDYNWIPYDCPEDEEIGTFCSRCNTHFVDIDGSKEEY